VLDVQITYFFDEMPSNVQDKSPSRLMGWRRRRPRLRAGPMAKRETLELVAPITAFRSPRSASRLFELISPSARGLRDED